MVASTRGFPAGSKRDGDLLANLDKLSSKEKRRLRTPMRTLNLKFTQRDYAFSHLNLLEEKIKTIRRCIGRKKDFENLKLKFGTEFVYIVMVELFAVLTDYLKLKDQTLYERYAKESRNTDFIKCDRCETENLFEPPSTENFSRPFHPLCCD